MITRIYGYLVWLIATLFVVYSFCLNTTAAVFSQAIRTSLHTDDFGVSMATGSFIIGFAFMQIPAGYLLDRFNARYVVSLGIFLLACGNLLISFTNTLLLFSLANFLQGVGASFSFITAAVLINQWFKPQAFPIIFGLTQTLSCILAGVIHYVFTLALTTTSWNQIYQLLATFGFILFCLSLIFIKNPSDLGGVKVPSLLASLSTVLKNKQVLLCSLATATSFGVLLAYASFWYMPIQSFFAIPELDAVIISGMVFVGIGIGTPLLGWLSNKINSRKMVIHISVILGTMAMLAGIYLPHFDTSSLLLIKCTSFFIGFFLSGAMLYYTIVSEISPDSTRGVALSVLNTTVFLFNTLMLFIPYILITALSKQFFTYLWVLPFCILLSILILTFIKDTSPK